jgi:hypothetical protein
MALDVNKDIIKRPDISGRFDFIYISILDVILPFKRVANYRNWAFARRNDVFAHRNSLLLLEFMFLLIESWFRS